jgi:hypothetical protein
LATIVDSPVLKRKTKNAQNDVRDRLERFATRVWALLIYFARHVPASRVTVRLLSLGWLAELNFRRDYVAVGKDRYRDSGNRIVAEAGTTESGD